VDKHVALLNVDGGTGVSPGAGGFWISGAFSISQSRRPVNGSTGIDFKYPAVIKSSSEAGTF
jgi:hypothetical protein